jgi:hypothetical protein
VKTEVLDVAAAGLRVRYESPSQFSANTAVSLACRVHATWPGRLPREAAALMDAGSEAWRKGLAGEGAAAVPAAMDLCNCRRQPLGLPQLQREINWSNVANALRT